MALVLAARGGSLGKDSRLGREVAAVSETGLRVRLEEDSVASPFATADVRFLGGMVIGSRYFVHTPVRAKWTEETDLEKGEGGWRK